MNNSINISNEKKKRPPWPTKRSTTGTGGTLKEWQPHPKNKGWEINVMTMEVRKKRKKK